MYKIILAGFLIVLQLSLATDKINIPLNRPPKKIGQDIIQVFNQRRSAGSFTDQKIGEDKLGSLLWMANGINLSLIHI